MVDTQNQSACRAVEKIEIRSMDAAHGQKYLLPCAGARHKKKLRSFLSLPEFKISATLSLQTDVLISRGSLFEHHEFTIFSPLPLSLISPFPLLIISSHLFAHLGSSSASLASLSAGTAFLARLGRPWSRSTCVPRRHRSERLRKMVSSLI
jgi:hypothetical protein